MVSLPRLTNLKSSLSYIWKTKSHSTADPTEEGFKGTAHFEICLAVWMSDYHCCLILSYGTQLFFSKVKSAPT